MKTIYSLNEVIKYFVLVTLCNNELGIFYIRLLRNLIVRPQLSPHTLQSIQYTLNP